MNELRAIAFDVVSYLTNAWYNVKPICVGILSVLTYVLFPTDAYIPAAIGLGGAVVLDIITRYYAEAVKHGGLIGALRTHSITSDALWAGSKKKLVSIFVIMILAGLSVRVSPLTSVAVFLSTIAYAVMFIRESQSVLENLIEAGHKDLHWLLFWLKRKEKQVLETDAIESPLETSYKGNDYNARI